MDTEAMLTNWARWCRDYSGIYPHIPTNWELIDQMEYKSCHESADEKIDRIARETPVDEREAERVELWVSQFPLLPQTALRVHYVYLYDGKRHDLRLDEQEFHGWRVRDLRKRLRLLGNGQPVDADTYDGALRDGAERIERAVQMWARAV